MNDTTEAVAEYWCGFCFQPWPCATRDDNGQACFGLRVDQQEYERRKAVYLERLRFQDAMRGLAQRTIVRANDPRNRTWADVYSEHLGR